MKRSCLLLVSGAISIFGVAQTAFAATDSTDFSVTVNPYLNVTLSDSEVSLPIIPSSAGTFGEKFFTASSSTNNVLGYSLNLSIKDTNTAQAVLTTNLTSDTINVNDGTKPVIPTFSTDDILTSAQFSASTSADHLNHWAMSLNDTDHYQKVINESTIASSDGPIADDVTTLNLATKLDLLTPPGSYAAYFNFEIVANVAPEPETGLETAMRNASKTKQNVTVYVDNNDKIIDSGDDAAGTSGTQKTVSLYKIQDITKYICNTVTTPTLADGTDIEPTPVVDTRNNHVYYVAKLKDGNCWMLDNLALNIADSTIKANLSADNTNASNTTLGYLKNGGGTAEDEFAVNGIKNWESEDGQKYSFPLVSSASKNLVPGVDVGHADIIASNRPMRIGMYYNYCAASAGSYCYGSVTGGQENAVDDTNTAIDAKEDICPANWRMPTGGSLPSSGGQANGGELTALYDEYKDSQSETNSANRFRSVLWLPLSGGFDGTAYSQGDIAGVWTSTYESSSYMFYLYASYYGGTSEPSVNTTWSYARNYGFSVRCVAK